MTGARMLPFLFEIGTDELPARFLPVERQHVAAGFAALLAELSLEHRGLRVLATPRRLAVLVEALAEQQADRTIEVKGPPLSAARGPDGSPTPAALGFARKNGVAIEDCLEMGDGKGGAFLGVRRTLAGRPAAELLAERLPGLLTAIPFPKTMHWGTSDFEYARPIQWLVALLGEQVLPLEMAGLRAGRVSRGHRTLAAGAPVEIAAPGAYLAALRDHGVEPDQDERRRVVREGGERLAREAGGRIVEDEELLQEVTDLLEHPTPFLGAVPESYFALPDEVIVTALKAHQRYFAVRREGDGRLLPVFFAVRDGDDTALDNVIRGNEKVLNARLNDALFYWRCDLKLTPDQHTARLADVTWLEGYGTVLDKVGRVGRLVERLWSAGLGDGGAPPPELLRAARICKFDLVTEMIRDGKEFTKLEGTIGARYAAAAGEAPAVCSLLEEYYRPRSAADGLPAGAAAAVLAAADRLDTLAGCWLAGFVPTGAKDPYALRRHTLAVLRILIDRAARLDLADVVAQALAGYATLADEPDVARPRRDPRLRPHAPGGATGRRGCLPGSGAGGPARARERPDRRRRLGPRPRRLPGTAGLPAARQGGQALPQHPGGTHPRGGRPGRLRGQVARRGRHPRGPGFLGAARAGRSRPGGGRGHGRARPARAAGGGGLHRGLPCAFRAGAGHRRVLRDGPGQRRPGRVAGTEARLPARDPWPVRPVRRSRRSGPPGIGILTSDRLISDREPHGGSLYF
ncbi:MAG: glycine--tRNA ligase subunit beta [Gemmatimonas sp.]|nr:glycine--tRNA ligase subunit beta [Gemmatimonas sp.]